VRFIKEHKNELLCFLFLSLASAIVYVWTRVKPKDPYVQLVFFLVTLAFCIPMYIFWRAIWREKLREPFALGAKKMFIGFARFLMRTVNRFGLFKGGRNVISGNTTVKYDYSVFKRSNRKRKNSYKPPRWKDMNTEREKLGYLYYKTVTKRISNGETVASHETPNEIKARFNDNEIENELFELYSDIRYDDRKTLDENEILELKDKLFL